MEYINIYLGTQVFVHIMRGPDYYRSPVTAVSLQTVPLTTQLLTKTTVLLPLTKRLTIVLSPLIVNTIPCARTTYLFLRSVFLMRTYYLFVQRTRAPSCLVQVYRYTTRLQRSD